MVQHLDSDHQISFESQKDETNNDCVILVIGLAVQVRWVRSASSRNFVSIELQSNGTEAILWQFLNQFIPGGGIVVASRPTSSSNSSSSQPAGDTSMSTGALNNSNAILASNSNVSANINQTFGGAQAASGNSTHRLSQVIHTELTFS